MNVVFFIVCVILAGSAMLRIAELSDNSDKFALRANLLNSAQPNII